MLQHHMADQEIKEDELEHEKTIMSGLLMTEEVAEPVSQQV